MEPLSSLWLALMVIFLIVEGATAAITTVWFAAGALIAMVASLFGAELWLQITLFVVVSVGLILSLRPLLKKFITPKKVRTNVDSVIDSQGIVIEAIDNLAGTGRVKLGGMEWSARSVTGERIAEKTVVKVEKIEGVKVFVSTVCVPVN